MIGAEETDESHYQRWIRKTISSLNDEADELRKEEADMIRILACKRREINKRLAIVDNLRLQMHAEEDDR